MSAGSGFIRYFLRDLVFAERGLQMARLARRFPPRSTVRYYFDRWSARGTHEEPSLLEQALKKSGGARA
jgi:hypothetical protein